MTRQSFNDFLNSPGPSTPRGRGRGRGAGRGGGGGGRGGSSGGGGGRSSFTTDYSNVPLDYSQLSGRKYTKMDGFDVAPYGPNSQTPSTPSAFTPRGRGGGGGGRGRGRGRGGGLGSVAQAATPGSGSRTPVTGLGYHGHGHSFRNGDVPGSGRTEALQRGARRRMVLGDTVGKNGVTWGGGAAPLFVKAGELFKDGELDEKPKSVEDVQEIPTPSFPEGRGPSESTSQFDSPIIPPQPEVRPWSPPRDINAVEDLLDEPGPALSPSNNVVDLVAQTETISLSDHTVAAEPELQAAIKQTEPDLQEGPQDELDTTLGGGPSEEAASSASSNGLEQDAAERDRLEQDAAVLNDAIPDTQTETAPDSEDEDVQALPHAEVSVTFLVDTGEAVATVPASEVEMESDEPANDLFFVDIQPVAEAPDRAQVVYDTFVAAPLGEPPVRAPSPEEEKIVFKRRSYAQPEPISLNIASSSMQQPSAAAEATAPIPALPATLNRRQKKALKKEKRIRNKGKAKKNAKNQKNKRRPQAYEGSDLDWGSDGPPSRMLDIEGVELDSDDSEDDEDILRDYLAGTLLGKQKAGGRDEGGEDGSDDDDEDEVDSEMEEDITRAYDDAAVGGEEQFELDTDEEENPDVEAESDDDDSEDSDGETEDDSSDLGEIHFSATRMEIDEDDDEDEDDDDDDLFNAKDSWDDTEWFIRNMEEALDGAEVSMDDRKARNKLFRTIEEGDFGDDWGLTPVKRNKKGSGIPLELQGQWERDRQKKAEKKRQRDLARLADLLDPYPATHGKKKGKKGKGMSKIEQAKLAHLIPESASRVAELFDIPSDFEEEGMVDPRRTGRMPNLLPGGRGFPALDAGIRSFIADSGKTTYSVPPMDKEGRRKVHMLAECYGLSSKSRGKGKARFTVLTKTLRTGQNVNEEKVTRLVSAATFSGGQFYKALYTKQKSEKKKGSGPGDRGSSARMREGETVGEGAERIGMENVGHKLLSKMGWVEGNRIGRMEGGLENPIVAIVKNTKMGLGA